MTGRASALRCSTSVRTLIIALSTPLAAVAPLSCAYASGAALPSNGQYVAGSGSIGKTGIAGLTINQSTNSGIINWNSFSIGKGNSVQFNNGSGATLNRVTGSDLSTIAGSLKGTGSIYLINPQGVIVSGTGKVLTGGSFAASTRDVSNSAFMSGSALHARGTSNGNVVNQGQIVSSNGDVTLIGNSVSNSGSISAKNGTASLNAGDDVLLAPAGSNGRIMVSGGNGDATNSGTISAAQAQLNAAGGNVYALGGNNGGIVRATGTQNIGGHVWLTSGSGNVSTAGTITATNANGSGGAIESTGANITTSGTIDASATAAGQSGGHVSIIADKTSGTTQVGGTIAAKGGAQGKGGFIETSGEHLHVADSAKITTLSPDGTVGTWLIDPADFTIAATGGDITGTLLSSELASSSVTIKSSQGTVHTSGNGDIFVNDGVTWSSGFTLTLDAARNINVTAPVSITGAGGLDLIYGDQAQSGIGNAANGDLLFGSAGNVSFTTVTSGDAIALAINGQAYTLENNISDLADAVTGDATGFYALAKGYDASGDNGGVAYTSSPIPTTFTGTFEGLGNTISNLTINSSSGGNIGLFAETDGATLRDIALKNISIIASGDVDNANIGGLVGDADNTSTSTVIDYVSVTGAITVGDASSSTSDVGGLAGAWNSFNDAATDLSSDVAITAGANATAGGLIGFAYGNGSITNSHATGNVTAGIGGVTGGFAGIISQLSIDNSYASGTVSMAGGAPSTGAAAGFVGAGLGGSFSNDYATGDVFLGTGGDAYAGGFAGSFSSTLDHSWASGNVHIAASDSQFAQILAGGLLGYLYNGGTVTNSFAAGSVIAAVIYGPTIGGFTGYADHSTSISNSYAVGSVSVAPATGSGLAGGFVGNGKGAISKSYETGAVSVGSNTEAGGFIGSNDTSATINESYSSGTVTGGDTPGGFAGVNSNSSGLGTSVADYYNSTANTGGAVGNDSASSESGVGGITAANMVKASSFVGWTFGTSTSGGPGWVIVDLDDSLNNTGSHTTGGTTPMLLSEYSTTITSAHQLELVSLALGANYTLGNDIDASGTTGGDVWTSNGFVPVGTERNGGVGAYSGTFDGQNHAIDGLFIDADPAGTHAELSWVGLFGALQGTAKNLDLTNVNITSNNSQGQFFPGTGALAGFSDGTIINVSSSGSVTASQADDANAAVGGLVGLYDLGTISNSHSSATVTDPGVNGSVGGLIGENYVGGTVTNSYATGDVTSGDNGDIGGFIGSAFALGALSISNSYATGTVTEGSSGWAGGFIGLGTQNVTITKSFATGDVSGTGNGDYGGFAGDTGGVISDSYAAGNVSKSSAITGGDLGGFLGGEDATGAVSRSYSTGGVSGDTTAILGGFIGSNGGNIDESYTLSKVTGGQRGKVGAFIGSNNNAGGAGATIKDFYDPDINGSAPPIGINSGSGTINIGGLTTLQMHTASNFTGWSADFGTTAGNSGWVIVDVDGSLNNAGSAAGGTTPILLSEYSTTINEAHQLQLMELAPTASYTLARDIDASGTSGGDVWGSQGFVAIGGNNSSGNFTGTFDGAGHTIDRLTFLDSTNSEEGMFGVIGAAGTVKNVTLANVSATAGITQPNLGALVGENDGTVSGVTVRGIVDGSMNSAAGGIAGDNDGTISQSSFTGTVSGLASAAVGGLVGLSDGEITGSYASATVSAGANGYAGGLVGLVESGASVHASYANGAVTGANNTETGGFVGENDGLIDTSYATGEATTIIGGFVGGFAGVVTASGDVEESYSLGQVFGGSGTAMGAFAGQNEGTLGTTKDDFYSTFSNGNTPAIGSGITSVPTLIGLDNTGLRSHGSYTGWTFGALGSGADWVIVDQNESLNNASSALGETAPMLLNEYSTSIANAHQLQLMLLDPAAQYAVTADFDASGTAHSADVWASHGFVPVGNDPGADGFTGSFDGGGHTISGLTIQNSAVSGVGLFSIVDAGSTIANVNLTNVSIVASGGNFDAGAIAGDSSGTISNVTVSGAISGSGSLSNLGGVVGFMTGSLSNAHSTASVSASFDSGGAGAGGLVGFNNFGTITQSSASGNVSMDGDDVTAGGLVGMNAGMISQSFATGNVTETDSTTSSANQGGGLAGTNDGGTISDSYAMGNVSMTGGADQLGGGFVGGNENSGTIANSYSLGAVTAGTKGGFVGLETDDSTLTRSYWDTETSGIPSANGVGNGEFGELIDMTTSELENALPTGFSGSTWNIVAGMSLPYLKWQFASGTPQVVSGILHSRIGGAGLANQTISLMQNGSNLNSAQTGGSVSTAGNGFYYFLLAPGSIATGITPGLLVYDVSRHAEAFAEGANDSVTGLDLTQNYLHDVTSDATLSEVNADFTAADGGTNPINTDSLQIDTTGDFTIDQTLNLGANTLLISANGGSINQSTGGTGSITAANLLLEGSTNYTFNNTANSISTLAMTNAGGLDLVDNHALTVGTVENVAGVNGGAGVALQTLTGGIAITQLLEANAHPLTLTSAGTIAESGFGRIAAASLTGSSVGGTTLNGANLIGKLGAFNTGGNYFQLLNAEALYVSGGDVNAGTSIVFLGTTGTGHALNIGNSVITGGTVTLSSSGTINETGAIHATTLVGESKGGATLNGANLIGAFDSFTNTDSGNIALTDAQTLYVGGGGLDDEVGSGGSVILTTTGAGHNLSLGSEVRGATVDLISAGTIIEGGSGIVEAGTLLGSSVGGATLNGVNAVRSFDSFTNTGGGNIALTTMMALYVGGGGVNAGTGNVTLTTTSANNILLGNVVTGATVDLISAGTLAEGGAGKIVATRLLGSSVGGATLNGANLIGTLGNLANSGAGGLTFTDGQSLTASGVVNAGTGALTLKTTGTSHNLSITNALTTTGTATLTSAGTIAESGSGRIAATTLAGTSAGGATLNGANVIGTLGAFTNTGAGGLAFTDSQTLAVSGTVNAGTGNLALKTTGAGHNLSITNAVATTGTATLTSAGTVAESGSGKITAGVLTGSSAGGATLNGANLIGKLAAFSNTSSGNIALTNAAALFVTGGNVNAGTGNVTLTTTGAGHALNIGSSTITGTVVNLTSAGTINESGVIQATTFTGSSAGGVALTGANVIGTLGAFTNTISGNIALTDVPALYVNGGAVNAGTGNVTLKTTGAGHALNIGNSVITGGTVTLTSAGTINETGAVHAATLTGSSAGGAALKGANLIGILGNFANTGAGNFALSDGQALTVNGAISVASSTGTLGLTTTVGNLTINGSLTAPTVTLNTAGEVLEGSAGAVTATNTLNVSAQTGINLNSTHNHIHAVGTRHTTSGPNVIAGIGM